MNEFVANAPMDNSDLLGAPEIELPPPTKMVEQRPPTRVLVLPPDPAQLGQKYVKLHTQNKIRQAFHQLAMGNIDAVQTWLHDVAKDSPAKAVELFIDLAKFSLPQLKETAVTVTQNNVTKTYQSSADIMAELEKPE